MSNFRVGQKVVCVRSFSGNEDYGFALPKKGEIYTVRNKEFSGDVPGLRFVELKNPVVRHVCGHICEPCFAATGFRPLVTQKTDISIFTDILDRANGRERSYSADLRGLHNAY
jgi:hypothetical protein